MQTISKMLNVQHVSGHNLQLHQIRLREHINFQLDIYVDIDYIWIINRFINAFMLLTMFMYYVLHLMV